MKRVVIFLLSFSFIAITGSPAMSSDAARVSGTLLVDGITFSSGGVPMTTPPLNGKSVLNGTLDPIAQIGSDGDFYINTVTNRLFGPKVNSAWPAGVSLVGPKGDTGAQGAKGDAGPSGQVSLTSICAAIVAEGLNTPSFCLSPSRLIGSWYVPYPNGGQAKGPIVITFIDDSTFMMAHDGDTTADPSGQPGIERGTYTWNATSGSITANVIVDTNGQWGFSHTAWPKTFTISADGSTLFINGVSFATKVKRTKLNPLIGGWYTPYPHGGQAKGPLVITFIDDTTFMMAHDGDKIADPNGQPGIERGTYAWTPNSVAVTANITVDTNGQWGFSHSGTMNFLVSGDGNTLFINGSAFATRVQ